MINFRGLFDDKSCAQLVHLQLSVQQSPEEHQESVVNFYFYRYTIFDRGTLGVHIGNLIQFYTLLLLTKIVVFILLVDCLKLLSRKASILILESDSPMYSVTRFNHFLKYVVVLHLLVFLICIGLLFHSRGLFVFPTVFLPSSFLISLVESFYLKVCRNFGPNCDPFFLSHNLVVCSCKNTLRT